MSPRRAIPLKESQKNGLPMWAIAIGLGVLVVIAAAVLFVLQTPSAPAPASSNVLTSGKTKGNADAPIAFIEFGDFK
ncbi:MAG: hypothetical protein HZC40_12145 [Chloroflexi bacterium]|nr:hypothetical protein [Chloroflexota bacterium]